MTIYQKTYLFAILAMTVLSCANKPRHVHDGNAIENKYSNGFEIQKINDGYILKVSNRFDDQGQNTYDYLLSSRTEYESGGNNVIIQIPVNKVVCLSTTHCAFISTLGKASTIKAVSGKNYIYNNEIQDMIFRKEIVEIGHENQINYERIISLNPDIVFAYGIDNKGMSSFQKLIDVGIPVVFVGDFLESTPLGRTEWIKFFACFYDRLDYATEYFDSVENNYLELKSEIESIKTEKPNVLVSLPWKGTWWTPGGNSFFANFIKDAGGNYVFANNTKTESVPLSIEEVYSSAYDIDFWLHPNEHSNKRSILNLEPRLSEFEAFKNARIYNNNKRTNIYGGNDFWESGIIKPDVILNDLINIFYPDTIKTPQLFYYTEIE